MRSVAKAAAIVLIASSAFRLGIYSVSFSGTGLAWTALIGSIVALAAGGFILFREPWKSWAR